MNVRWRYLSVLLSVKVSVFSEEAEEVDERKEESRLPRLRAAPDGIEMIAACPVKERMQKGTVVILMIHVGVKDRRDEQRAHATTIQSLDALTHGCRLTVTEDVVDDLYRAQQGLTMFRYILIAH